MNNVKCNVDANPIQSGPKDKQLSSPKNSLTFTSGEHNIRREVLKVPKDWLAY